MVEESREGYYTHPLTGELLKRTGKYVDIIGDVPEELINAEYIVEDFDDEDLFHMSPYPQYGEH